MPTVLAPLTLPMLLNYILLTQQDQSGPTTTLIICSSREAFLQNLSHSLQNQDKHKADSLQELTIPTLHNLFTARHVRVAFCSSVQTLLVCLTAGRTGAKHGIGERQGEQRLVLVNPLSLHAPTSSFSAQGLSRTFAAAVEAAVRVDAKLLMVECVGRWRETREEDGEEEEEQVDAMIRGGDRDRDRDDRAEAEEEDPWEQEVSILNVSTRKFASGSSDRVWAGRSIKVRRIAGRWFRFDTIGNGCRGTDEADKADKAG